MTFATSSLLNTAAAAAAASCHDLPTRYVAIPGAAWAQRLQTPTAYHTYGTLASLILHTLTTLLL